jgi:hypothetical protein
VSKCKNDKTKTKKKYHVEDTSFYLTVCWSTFCDYNKIPEIINFNRGEVSFDSQHFQLALFGGPVAKQQIMMGAHVTDTAHLTAVSKQNREEKKEPESQYPLQGCIPNDLTSCHWTPLPATAPHFLMISPSPNSTLG